MDYVTYPERVFINILFYKYLKMYYNNYNPLIKFNQNLNIIKMKVTSFGDSTVDVFVQQKQ